MQLKIDNRIFMGKYIDLPDAIISLYHHNGTNVRLFDSDAITITLVNDADVQFFKSWHKELENKPKVEYAKDIIITTVYGIGILRGCFPLLNFLNENEVRIVCDVYEIIKD